MAFDMNIEQAKDAILVHLKGDLDINASPSFKEAVIKACEKEPKEVIFDLSDLDYLDSTGLGALMAIYKVTQKHGHKIRIRNAKKNVRKLFTITELDNEFIMEDADGNR